MGLVLLSCSSQIPTSGHRNLAHIVAHARTISLFPCVAYVLALDLCIPSRISPVRSARYHRKLATLQQAPMPTTRPATINTNSALPPTGTATGSKRGSSPRLPIYTQGGAGQLVGGSAPAGMTSGPELSPEMENERAAGTAGVRGGDDSESGGESCPFLELEKKPLLKVFVFLSAPEVLRAAQVCRSMFRKVRKCIERAERDK